MPTIDETLRIAVQHHQAGRLQQAQQHYEEVLRVDPQNVDGLHLLGVVLNQQGNHARAIESIRAALQLQPDSPVFLTNLAAVHSSAGNHAEAAAYCQKALQVEPGNLKAHFDLGCAYRAQGKLEEAAASLKSALQINADFVDAHITLARVRKEQDDHAEAAACCQRALRIEPGNFKAHYDLGCAFRAQGKLEEAAASLERALQIKEDFVEAHITLALVRNEQGRLEESVAECQRALELRPDYPDGLTFLAFAFEKLGMYERADALYEKAIETDQVCARAHFNRSLHWLRQGDFERGLSEYEWRWETVVPPRGFVQPVWDGSSLKGKTVLLYSDQGFGDTLQFVRYATLVGAKGGTVIVECQRPLMRLLKSCDGVSKIVAAGDKLSAFDTHAALASLPLILETRLESIPAAVPYLSADKPSIEHWRNRLAQLEGFKVGITWQGDPGHGNDRYRSIALSKFGLLADIPGVQLVGLQKGHGSEQLADPRIRFSVTDVEAEIDDFLDTAAIMMNLDLVITCDTSMAHLAGALGVPVWVAIPFVPDWRWLLDRDDSPWYPTMRLFRQTKLDNWDDVFARIQAALGDLACQSTQNGNELDKASQCDGAMPLTQHPDRSVADQRADDAVTGQNEVEARGAKCHQSAERYNRLGYESVKKGCLDEAVDYFRRALQLNPDSAGAHSNLGNALNDQDRFDEAIEYLERAIQIQPDCAEAHNNLGNALRNKGLIDEAIAACGRAIKLRPDYAVARSNRALLRLLNGEFASAWSDYGWAWKVEGRPVREFRQPMWNGSPLNGKTILLYSEQGFGDTLQFIRYAPLVGLHGARVVVECPKSLGRVLASCSAIDEIIETGAQLPPFDVHASLMRLPELFRTNLESIPASVPYLTAASDRIEHWRARLCHLSGSKAGICWRGSTKHALDRRRSISLKAFRRLADIAECSLVSLQKGPATRELSEVGFNVFDATSEIHDFMDTAAIMMNLDLVITCDTSVAHLAGALGVPVWVAIPFTPDWRWMLDRDDSPWYPAMRLFRQTKLNDWDEVFERIQAELRDVVCQSIQNGDELVKASQCHGTMPLAQHPDRSIANQGAVDAAAGQNGVEARRAKSDQTAEQCNTFGCKSLEEGRLEEAAGYFRRAVQLDPGFAGAYSNLGNVLNDQDRFDEAIECFERAIQIQPDFADAYNNLGNTLHNKGLVDEAITKCRRAVQLRPDYAVAHLNLAFFQLLKGDFASAWCDYAWCGKVEGRPVRKFSQPTWNGSPLNGQTILLYSDQGYGDALQFIRYASLVGRHRGRIVVECPKSLGGLLASCSGVDQIIEAGAKLPPFDVHASLMRLPELFRTNLESIPASVPYLTAASDRIEQWRGRINHLSGSKVGICWQGNAIHRADRRRSIPLKAFGQLADIAECSLVSLQKGPATQELSEVGFNVFDVTSEIHDFMETAAIMMNLDLVITCDTAVAHLAGALGVPVWVALPIVPDWRWLLDRDDSPWYPTIRLFRQTKLNDWDEVFQRIASALSKNT